MFQVCTISIILAFPKELLNILKFKLLSPMKIKLSCPKTKADNHHKINNSVEKIKPKKKINQKLNPEPPLTSLKSTILPENSKYISLVTHNT